MTGISSTGLISGIDTASLINQLIAVASGPKTLAQNRLIQLKAQQAAYLDLNTQLSSLKSAAATFRINSVFDSKKATSSNTDLLTATASGGAQPGTYSFIVDRLVSSRQLLTTGFQDKDVSAIGASQFTFESYQGRLDRDIELSALNDGAGIDRGKIRINDGTDTAEVDLTRAATVQDVLDEINNSGLNVEARVRGGHFEIAGATAVTNAGTADTAESLGLIGTYDGHTAGVSGGSWVGFRVYEMTGNTALTSLNDGNGVSIRQSSVTNGVTPDFKITFNNGADVDVDIGLGEIWGPDGEGGFEVQEAAVTTVQGMLDRINQQIADAGIDATASIDGETGALSITTNDGSTIKELEQQGTAKTLRDLGLSEFTGGSSASITGSRIFSGLGSTLISGLNGGGSSGGIGGDGALTFTDRDGQSVSFNLSSLPSFNTVEGLIDELNTKLADNSVGIALSLNDAGTGLMATDTSGGAGNLIITGTGGNDTAAGLGLSTGATGVADNTFQGTSLQHRYISEATRLEDLRNGDGIGTGKIRITDASGKAVEINISDTQVTVFDLIKQIQTQASSAGLSTLSVGINDQGDGIVISDSSTSGSAITIEDVTGTVAKNLRLAGTADGTGADNFIDGSFETSVTFDATDTLQDMVTKINNAGAPAAVSILNDGTTQRPYRLSFTARDSGTAGRFTFDTHGFDLGYDVLDEGNDARVFFGSASAATGILLTSSTNTLDNVITGVNIDLHATSDEAVQVTVTDDTAAIETKITSFVDAYNRVIDSMNKYTRYDSDTGDRGALLGDGLVLGMRSGLFGTAQSSNYGFNDSYNRLAEVGVTVGTDGNLEFNSTKFREALANDPQAVADIFERRTTDSESTGDSNLPDGVTVNDTNARDTYSEMGVLVRLEEFAKTYTDSIDGVLTARSQSLDTQILRQQDRIDELQTGLDRQRAQLQAQFTAMEQALAQLQSQQSALATLSQLG
ncbi:MAG: flagellar filament capping protein FliD [Phycisphaeraceae bacterium]|nr:MAG: flagellar filament capping protein FliD [Phycisphaeraceae bacterium]